MKINQRGFTVVEGFLIVIIIAMLSGVGFFVYNANKDSKQQAESSGTSTVNEESSGQKYIEFKELGIKIQTNDTLDGLTYQVETGNPNLYLTTNELTQLIKDCNGGVEPIGTSATFMSVSKKEGQYPSTQTIDTGALVKQFPEFYIAAAYPNGATYPAECKDDKKIQALMASLKTAAQESFKNAELIQ